MVFLDALLVKVRDNHVVTSNPAHIGLGIDADGDKHVLGIWDRQDAPGGPWRTPPPGREAARFWGSVMADLRNRGIRDAIIACCDGLGDQFTQASLLGQRHHRDQACPRH